MRTVILSVVVVSGLVACAGSEPKPAEQPTTAGSHEEQKDLPPSQTGADLLRYVRESDKKFVISPREGRPGLANHHVSVDGKDVWPPSGENCAALISCCEDVSAKEESKHLALPCQLALGRDGQCSTALDTVRKILGEQNLSSAACAP